MVSTAGHPGLKGRIPTEDAVAVRRLREAGAIILGKTNVPVFSGDFQAFNPVHGVTNNPWNAAFSAGGSSGGAAAAVATGMTSFEIGTDQGSSIRWPAATNGIVGLKTSWGLVSSWGMVPPPPEKRTERNVELAVVGPMARHAEDLDLLLPILAGPRNAAVAAPALKPPRRTEPKGLRVAVWLDEPFAPVERTVAEACATPRRCLRAKAPSSTKRPALLPLRGGLRGLRTAQPLDRRLRPPREDPRQDRRRGRLLRAGGPVAPGAAGAGHAHDALAPPGGRPAAEAHHPPMGELLRAVRRGADALRPCRGAGA